MAYYTNIIEKIRGFFRPKPQYTGIRKLLEEQREILKKVNYDVEKDPSKLELFNKKEDWTRLKKYALSN